MRKREREVERFANKPKALPRRVPRYPKCPPQGGAPFASAISQKEDAASFSSCVVVVVCVCVCVCVCEWKESDVVIPPRWIHRAVIVEHAACLPACLSVCSRLSCLLTSLLR